jgi:hypothetical protein
MLQVGGTKCGMNSKNLGLQAGRPGLWVRLKIHIEMRRRRGRIG